MGHLRDRLGRLALRLPALRKLYAEREARRAHQARISTFRGEGHFYSPLPDLDEVRARRDRIFGRTHDSVAGVDLAPERQLELLSAMARFYPELPFGEQPPEGLRFGLDNPRFCWGDAIVLYGMLRVEEPRRVIEVGSGHSSALLLDLNDTVFDQRLELTFVEPNPESLHALLRPGEVVDLLQQPLQDVALELFDELAEGDVLFIDSTHVSKVGSDVNRLFFEVIPRLRPGVRVHLHDVFWPFEYPEAWVMEGRAWNEAYLLRAFLTFNRVFGVEYFCDYVARCHLERLKAAMPLCMRNPGGSIWLRRLGE